MKFYILALAAGGFVGCGIYFSNYWEYIIAIAPVVLWLSWVFWDCERY